MQRWKTTLAVGTAIVSCAVAALDTADAQDKKYLFVMVSHMRPNDSNSKWFELSLPTFEEKLPRRRHRVPVDQRVYVQLIEQAVASNPDGLAVAVTEPGALEGAINKAIEQASR